MAVQWQLLRACYLNTEFRYPLVPVLECVPVVDEVKDAVNLVNVPIQPAFTDHSRGDGFCLARAYLEQIPKLFEANVP